MSKFTVISNKPAETNNYKTKKLYIGAADMKVVMYNPTLEEIKLNGNFYSKEEPVYVTEKGISNIFYLEGVLNEEPIYAKLNIWVSKEPNISQKTGKAEFMDINNNTAWLEVTNKGKAIKNDSKFFDFATAFPTHMGFKSLVDLVSILLGYDKANISIKYQNDKIKKDNDIIALTEEGEIKELLPLYRLSLDLDKLASGNTSEIKEILNEVIEAENMIKVGLGVKDGLYQEVWNTKFGNPGNPPTAASLNGAKQIVENKNGGILASKEYAENNNKDFAYYPTDNMTLRLFDPSVLGTAEDTINKSMPKAGGVPKMPSSMPAGPKLPGKLTPPVG